MHCISCQSAACALLALQTSGQNLTFTHLLCIAIEIQESKMTTQSSMLHIRLDTQLKEDATQALAAMGLTTADAVRLLLHRVVSEQAFPLELKVPNAQTRAAIEEANQILAGRAARFQNEQELFDALDAKI
jgi:DNA-damage-inducible protein J